MPPPASAGDQLYARLSELLAPPAEPETASSLVILEPSGKDVSVTTPGTPAAVEALADLANSIPAPTATFLDTGAVYDGIWDFVLRSATPTGAGGEPERATLASLIADNRAEFELMARARENLPGAVFRPVLTDPEDWLGEEGWTSASFRIGEELPDTPEPGPPVPGGAPGLNWRRLDPVPRPSPGPPVWGDPPRPGYRPMMLRTGERGRPDVIAGPLPGVGGPVHGPAPVVIDPAALRALRHALETGEEPADLAATRPAWRAMWEASRALDVVSEVAPAVPSPSGFELSFRYRVVGLRRPWLRAHLCRLGGWSIPGLPPGGLSSGAAAGNSGLLPAITTRMLVVRDLVVRAAWSEADRERAAGARTLALGPFVLTGAEGFDGTQITRPGPQVVAWLASLVPACPL